MCAAPGCRRWQRRKSGSTPNSRRACARRWPPPKDSIRSTVPALPKLVDPAFSHALAERRDRLFCKLLRPWQLSMPLVAMADDIETHGLAGARLPLAVALQRAHALASLHALACDGRLPSGMDGPLMSLPPGVQAGYLSVTRAD